MIEEGLRTDNNSYYVTSNNEYLLDELIELPNFENKKIAAINLLSRKVRTILLPLYLKENSKKLKGLKTNIGPTDIELLKFLIDHECIKSDILIFGLVGLHNEAVSFLKDYSRVFVKNNRNSTFLIYDYSPNYENTFIENLGSGTD